MTDPASGTAAATTALITSGGSLLGLGALVPPGASPWEFVWGIAFAMLGAFCWQYIVALARRQIEADNNVPIDQRSRVDNTLVVYAVLGAPLSAAVFIVGIHLAKGATGFGDLTWIQSAGGFMVVGPVGPKIVIKAVATIITFVSSRFGGK